MSFSPGMPDWGGIGCMVQTLFAGSTERAGVALLDLNDSGSDDVERERLKRLIDQARQEGR